MSGDVGVPVGGTGLLGSGSLLVQLGNGVNYGDGLRATAGALRRSPLSTACDGTLLWGPSATFNASWLAGQTRYFQAFYRDNSGPCAFGFNVSNGVAITFTP